MYILKFQHAARTMHLVF